MGRAQPRAYLPRSPDQIDFESFSRALLCFVEPVRASIRPGEIGIDDERQWVELNRALTFLDRLIRSISRVFRARFSASSNRCAQAYVQAKSALMMSDNGSSSTARLPSSIA